MPNNDPGQWIEVIVTYGPFGNTADYKKANRGDQKGKAAVHRYIMHADVAARLKADWKRASLQVSPLLKKTYRQIKNNQGFSGDLLLEF